MSIDGVDDLRGIQAAGRVVADCLKMMMGASVAGISTIDLDRLGEEFLAQHGAVSAPRKCYEFPGTTCISINHEVAHGIPSARKIKTGDLVNIDVSAELNGYFADTGRSFVVGNNLRCEKLCLASREALNAAMKVARAGAKLNGIGAAIEKVASSHGFTVIRNLGSHGVGRDLHEEPKFIPGFFDPRDTRVLKKNMVITIEPFISDGADMCWEMGDGWTLVTNDKHRTAQVEHTLIITDSDPIVATLWS